MNQTSPITMFTKPPQTDTVDCLLIGFNDLDVAHYERLVRAMGTDSGAYRDLALAIVNQDGQPRRSLDLLTELHYEGREQPAIPLNNTDFLWPTITYLGSFLHKRGYTFDFVNRFQLEKDRLREKLQSGNIRSVAITTTLYVIPEPILEIIEFVRGVDSKIQIIVGGPYISNNTNTLDGDSLQRFFKLIDADIYVDASEGEQALVDVLGALRRGGGFDSIANIAFRRGDGYVKTPTRPEANDLDAEIVDHRLFSGDTGQFVSLRTAKSCPFNCAFCGFPTRAGKYLYLSVDRVERELNALRDLGTVSTITFLDDTFNVPKGRFRELLRMMIRNKYSFKWNSYYRSDHGDAETVELMARAGCEGVFLGVESGSDTILQKMNKTSRAKHYRSAIAMFREHGIVTHANLIIGFPGETIATVQETIDLIEEARPDFFRAQLWYADPMTPIWTRREEFGIKGEAFFWSHDTMDSATACDLVEKLFLGIENSVWLPQFGFELWSVFYLQRFGMTLEHVKTFVRSFNALVKDKLLDGNPDACDSRLMESLRVSAQFDRGRSADLACVELRSGRAYMAAETYWCERFGHSSPPRLFDTIDEHPQAILRRGAARLAPQTLRNLEESACADATRVASVAVGLLRILGIEDLAVRVDCMDGVSVPLRIRIRPDREINDLVGEIDAQMQQARTHLRFARHFLGNKERLAQYDAIPPRFEVAIVFGAGLNPAGEGLQVNLPCTQAEPAITVTLAGGNPQLPERLANQIAAVLDHASAKPDCVVATLGETLVLPESATRTPSSDSNEAFQF